MLVRSTQALAFVVSLTLLAASCSLTTDLSGLQHGEGGGASGTSASSMSTAAAGTSGASGGAVCGDGVIQGGEECDDGNAESDDGCTGCIVDCGHAGEFEDPATHHCYWYDPNVFATFNDAVTGCTSWRKNATLAVVTSQEESFFLTVTQGIQPRTWLGATDVIQPGTYQWVNGEPWSYDHWADTYPDNAVGTEDCVMFGFDNLRWENSSCSSGRRMLCESSPFGQQP